MFRAAEQRYGTLKERVEGQQGELQKLQERLQAAELEYQRGRSKLKATAGELESLASRVRSSNKAARGEADMQSGEPCDWHGLVQELSGHFDAWSSNPTPPHPTVSPLSGLIEDLRELPSKAALQLRSDSANAAAAASSQAKALDKSLRRLAKQYGF
jgi:uncharacterized protein involved in exopolysaccharide biosynthesis